MILDCPACGAALVYDPESGKMKCESCSNLFETYELQEDFLRRGERELQHQYTHSPTDNIQQFDSENSLADNTPQFDPIGSFDNPIYDHASDNNESIALNKQTSDNTMECSIYTCTSCGAEIMVNDVEVSTFCAYCGQPTVIFSRVATTKRPRYIIPFSVTKERAVSLIKERFDKGFFVPDDIKNVKMERVRGIYIPYWLFDIHYEDKEHLMGTVGSGKNSRTYFYYREASCDFEKLGLDGSKQLDNTTSRKLNPYYPKYLKDFSMEYLSGFYADQYDDNMDKLKGQAILRAQNMFENAMKRSVSATGVKIIKKYPVFEITGTEYALYPAWFLTFINDGTPYTLLVNGQTEKVVGGIPYDKKKIKFYFLLLGAMLSLIAFCIVYPILFKAGEDLFNIIFLLGAIGIVSFTAGIKNFEKVKASTRLTSLSETNHYVKNRQEG